MIDTAGACLPRIEAEDIPFPVFYVLSNPYQFENFFWNSMD